MAEPELCKHCHQPLKPADSGVMDGYRQHASGLARCQVMGVPYGHLAEAEGTPCRSTYPNPCLGAFGGKEWP